ncbi:Protein of unknown function, partial [Gryllus bimaculatus]
TWTTDATTDATTTDIASTDAVATTLTDAEADTHTYALDGEDKQSKEGEEDDEEEEEEEEEQDDLQSWLSGHERYERCLRQLQQDLGLSDTEAAGAGPAAAWASQRLPAPAEDARARRRLVRCVADQLVAAVRDVVHRFRQRPPFAPYQPIERAHAHQ